MRSDLWDAMRRPGDILHVLLSRGRRHWRQPLNKDYIVFAIFPFGGGGGGGSSAVRSKAAGPALQELGRLVAQEDLATESNQKAPDKTGDGHLAV